MCFPSASSPTAVPADGGEGWGVTGSRTACRTACRPGSGWSECGQERRRGRVRPAGPALAEPGLARDHRPDLGLGTWAGGGVQSHGLADVGVDLVRGGRVPGGDERSQGLAVQLVFRVRQDRQQEVAGARLVGGDQPADSSETPAPGRCRARARHGRRPAAGGLRPCNRPGRSGPSTSVGRLRVRPLVSRLSSGTIPSPRLTSSRARPRGPQTSGRRVAGPGRRRSACPRVTGRRESKTGRGTGREASAGPRARKALALVIPEPRRVGVLVS